MKFLRVSFFASILFSLAIWTTPGVCSMDSMKSMKLPTELQGIGIDQRLNQQVPLDLTFLDETGKQVTLGSLVNNKPTLLVLAYYTCPRLCTLVLNGVADAAKKTGLKLGKDFNIITVSIDPKDTPKTAAKKKAVYMNAMGTLANPEGWHFLTGGQASIRKLADAVGFHYKPDELMGQFAHAAGIMILTPKGKLSHYFYGIDYPPRDLRLALVSASGGKIGNPVDELLLFCCSFNPTTGRYTVVVFKVVRVFCALLVLGLGSLIFVVSRSKKRTA